MAAPSDPSAPSNTSAPSAKALVGRYKFVPHYPHVNDVRVLNFPTDSSVGAVYFSSVGATPQGNDPHRPARGMIKVPRGQVVTFAPSHRLCQNPAILRNLAPNSIDRFALNISSMDDAEDKFCDNTLSYVSHLKGLVELLVDRSNSTNAGVAGVKDLPGLQVLSGNETVLDGSCLNVFAGHKELRCISLYSSEMSDKTMKYLAALPNLESLNIAHCNVSDEGLKQLQNCKKLALLDLSVNAKITDNCVPILLKMKSLRYVSLFRTGIKNKAVVPLRNSSIEVIILPEPVQYQSQISLIRKAMPKVGVIGISDPAKRPIDPEVQKMYAPLH